MVAGTQAGKVRQSGGRETKEHISPLQLLKLWPECTEPPFNQISASEISEREESHSSKYSERTAPGDGYWNKKKV